MRGGGPMDTDLLQFYIDIGENELRNDGRDIYCPKGRVYMNCGYFVNCECSTYTSLIGLAALLLDYLTTDSVCVADGLPPFC